MRGDHILGKLGKCLYTCENREAAAHGGNLPFYKRLEETRRIGSDLADKPFRDYQIFHGIASNAFFETEFQKMQRNYVFNDADILSKDFIIQQWKKL